MPVFELEANGKSFEIEAPSQAAALTAFQSFTGGARSNAPESQRQISLPSYDALGNPTGEQQTVDAGQQSTSPAVRQSDDILKGFAGGLVRGAAGTVGLVTDTLPNALNKLADTGAGLATGETGEEQRQRVTDRRANVTFPGASDALSTKGIQRGIETVTGPAYEPSTRAGKLASGAGEFLPGSLIGPAGQMGRNAVAFGLIPGVASEAAGQAFEGSAAEPYARGIAGVTAGVGGALAMRNNSAANLVRNSLDGVTPQQLDAAEQLFLQAQQMGTPISRAEAIQSVTRGATRIGDLQHTVEGMGGMKPFYAQRPAQNEAAARRTFDAVAPPNLDPSQIGPGIGREAGGIVQDVRDAINTATRPMYDAARQNLVPQQVHAAMMADPLFAETVNTIRNDPARNAVVRASSDRSVSMYDAVAKELEQRSRNAAQPLNPQANQSIASVTGNLGGDIKDIAVAADRAATGGPSSYEAALATQARMRQGYLEPLLQGPIGKIAGRDTTTQKAIAALFPENPLPNSQQEIATTVGALAQRSPRLAGDLVRAHAEGVFNEASQRLAAGGFNQSGGAKFAAVLRGEPQQAANLEASVRALPNGDATWRGFNALLENFEAQQFRQAAGSRTAFKIPGVEDLKSGGIVNNVAQVVGTGGIKLPQKIMTAIQNWNVGQNLDDLARLLTDPAASGAFRSIANTPAGSNQALAVTARLASIALNSRKPEREPTRVNVPVGQNLR